MAWFFWKDKGPAWVQAEEREFIKAVNSLQTLHTPKKISPSGLTTCGAQTFIDTAMVTLMSTEGC